MPVNAYPSFLNVFGIRAPDGSLNIPPSWQNGIAAATNCGEIIGLQVAGVMSDRVGYRWTLILALICLTGFIFVPFYGITVYNLSFGD
jgi:SP family general alpha glucoside:H+ symporter-like MFS transporter